MNEVTSEVTSVIAMLDSKAKVADVVAKLNEVIAKVNELSTTHVAQKNTGVRNYGPESQRKMTDEDAWRIMYGDMKSMKVKDIADKLGLSRGQVYSVRGNYTFTHVKADSFKTEQATVETGSAEQ